MAEPTASIEKSWNPPPELGDVTVIVYRMEPGGSEVRINWPEAALQGGAAGAQYRNEFVKLIQSELQTTLLQ
jgi:hypothetical protein